MNYTLELIKVIAILGLVLGLFYLVVKLLKNNYLVNQTNQLQVLERCYLSNNQVIYLIKVVDDIWLVTATEDNLEFIQQVELNEAEINTVSENNLLNLLQKGKDETDES
ncbi:hypothetical protein JCM16358_07640 [Halanaerocella petrolearia]